MVKCQDCGFLALRDREYGVLGEADWEWRKGIWRMGGSVLTQWPVCFAMAMDMYDVIQKQRSGRGGEAAIVWEIIETGRECKYFTRYQQGFSPKEHREMLDRQWMLEWQAKREQEDKEWREHQEDKAEKRHQEQMRQLEKTHNRELAILGGLVTLAIAIVTILSAAIEAGWISPWFGLR